MQVARRRCGPLILHGGSGPAAGAGHRWHEGAMSRHVARRFGACRCRGGAKVSRKRREPLISSVRFGRFVAGVGHRWYEDAMSRRCRSTVRVFAAAGVG